MAVFDSVTKALSGRGSSSKFDFGPKFQPQRTEAVGNIRDAFLGKGEALKGLLSKVSPGFGKLTESRVAGIRDRSRAAIGNLSSNLRLRKISGSSFGQDALARGRAESAREEDRVRAESFLQELDATTKLIDQQFNANAAAFQAVLQDLQFGEGLALQATAAMSQLAQLEAQLAADSLSGIGSFFGESIFEPLTGGEGGLFETIGKDLAKQFSERNNK